MGRPVRHLTSISADGGLAAGGSGDPDALSPRRGELWEPRRIVPEVDERHVLPDQGLFRGCDVAVEGDPADQEIGVDPRDDRTRVVRAERVVRLVRAADQRTPSRDVAEKRAEAPKEGPGIWYDRAMEWAQAAGDKGSQGFLLIRKSQMAYDARDGHRVLMLARTALDGPWKLDPWLRAEALLQVVKGQAMTGQAVRLGEVTDQAYTLAVGRERLLDLRVATAWSEVGEPERAADLYAGVLFGGALSRRDVGFFTARRSAALARSGRPEGSAVEAIEALDAARQIGSARTGVIVRDTLTALRRWSSVPAVAELEAAVSARP